MTLNLHDAGNGDGLMDVQGRGFHAIDTMNTGRLTTVPAEVEDFLDQFNNVAVDIDYDEVMKTIPQAQFAWQGAGGALAQPIRAACEGLLIEFVQNDSDEPEATLLASLVFMIEQMESDGRYVSPSVVALSLATDEDNIGDTAICYTEKRGDGRIQENLLAEDIQIEVVSDTSAERPSVEWRGEAVQSDSLNHEWPKGSGSTVRVAATAAASSLLSNGNFQSTTIENIPDDWIIHVGSVGSTIRVTDPHVQTIRISGTPTDGAYTLSWENAQGIVRSTDSLAFDSSASVVQTALRLIPDLEEITVTSTGTNPDLTHTITFVGLAGRAETIASVDHLTGGTPVITHKVTVFGDDGAYRGRALRLDSDGSELTEVYHSLSLDRETVYFCHFRIKRTTNPDESSSSSSQEFSSWSSSSSTSSTSSASTSSSSQEFSSWSSSSQSSSSSSSSSSTSSSSSSQEFSSWSSSSSSTSSQYSEELRVEIVDEIGGAVSLDSAGNQNALKIDAGAISTTSHDSMFFSFRLKQTVSQPVYLRIRVVEPFDADDTIYIDDMAIVQATELYTGGPFVAAFSGVAAAVNEDKWILTATNDRAGAIQEWYNRAFDMQNKELLLPSSGTDLIPDSVIS